MKTFVGWKPLTVVLVATFTLAGCMHTPAQEAPRQDDTSMENGDQGMQATQVEGEGTLSIGITDAAFETEAYEEMYVTIDNLRVFSEAEGRINVDTQVDTFNLLELKNNTQQQLVAQLDVAAETLSNISFELRDVYAVEGDTRVDFATQEEITLPVDIEVAENGHTYMLLDFELDRSTINVEGEAMVFEPYITVDARSNVELSIESESGNMIFLNAEGGELEFSSSLKVEFEGDASDDQDGEEDTDTSAGAEGSAEGEIDIDLNGIDAETDTEAEGTVEGTTDGVDTTVEGTGEVDAGSTIDY